MKVFLDGLWCDTQEDWGYKTDKQFLTAVWTQNQAMKKLLLDIMKILNKENKENKWTPLIEKVTALSNFK
jgi:hypothetical protein